MYVCTNTLLLSHPFSEIFYEFKLFVHASKSVYILKLQEMSFVQVIHTCMYKF